MDLELFSVMKINNGKGCRRAGEKKDKNTRGKYQTFPQKSRERTAYMKLHLGERIDNKLIYLEILCEEARLISSVYDHRNNTLQMMFMTMM